MVAGAKGACAVIHLLENARTLPDNDPRYNRTAYTEKAGGGSSFDIMNRYIALEFCKKN